MSDILNRRTGAIYIRVSTDKQEELSPDAQKRLLFDYAKNNSIDVPSEYVFQDNGISGRNAKKRPAFQKMVGLCKSKEHPIDVIIVWKFSRFARNQEESIVYKSLLKKNEVDVVSVSEPLVDGPFGSLIERIIEWMDEYYSIRLSGEVMRGMTENAMRGHYQSDAPIGYRSPGNGEPPIIDPDTVQIPLMIKDMFLSGSTLLQIARRLNDSGYRTKRGNTWDNRGVQYVLENPFYYGKSRWNYTDRGRKLKPTDEVVYADGIWEPLWDEDTYQQIQKLLAERKQVHRKSRDVASTKHWLSGVLVCSSCGATLGYSKSNYSFQCWKYSRGQCNTSHAVLVKYAEATVIDYLDGILESNAPIKYRIVRSSTNSDSRIDDLHRQLDRLAQKEKRIKAAYQDGIDTLEEYKSNKTSLNKSREEIESEIAELDKITIDKAKADQMMRDNISALLLVLKDDSADYVQKGTALRGNVDKIIFDRANNNFDFYLKLVI